MRLQFWIGYFAGVINGYIAFTLDGSPLSVTLFMVAVLIVALVACDMESWIKGEGK